MTSALANGRITALASHRAVHRAFSWMHLHEQQLQRWHREFLAIPAPPFGEAPRARWFAARFTELGLTNVHLDDEGNALAELSTAPATTTSEADESGLQATDFGASVPTDGQRASAPAPDINSPVVLLSAHLDTVFPAGTDCTPREQEGRLLCPGATDNGAGLTALLAIAAAIRHAELTPPCTILFAANVGEEGEGDLRGMRHIFSAPPYAGRIRAALALEGAGASTVVDRALGGRRLRVEISGPGGHSWADADRPSPINALADALSTLARLPLPENPRTTLNCGLISGGTSINSIAAEARADLDLRSISSDALDRLEQQVLDIVSAATQGESRRSRAHDALRLQVRRIGDRTAGELPQQSPLALSLRAVDRHLGIATDFRIGSTDANLPLSLGVPALAIGAGGTGGGIHTLNEWFDPAGRALALRRILLLLLDTCNLTADL
ncbi:MAG TPA: M20/M25/M40 family metallo-hydrolase [Acidobacteriaceae bacterium]|nr:M20/M25/M40 family metallo-hydrolase [Acidobacteriaceae bacterium]